MEEMRTIHKILEKEYTTWDLGIDERIILKQILKK
jgi:hypothetical protein